jgi:hypothetical protein
MNEILDFVNIEHLAQKNWKTIDFYENKWNQYNTVMYNGYNVGEKFPNVFSGCFLSQDTCGPPTMIDDYLTSVSSSVNYLASGSRRPRLTSLLTADGVNFNRPAT